jgi:hypothetical protein
MNVAFVENWSPLLRVAPSPADSLASRSSVSEEVITPEQFFTPADRSGATWTPERRLLLAVLEDAVVMYLRYRNNFSTRGKRLFRETQKWFDSQDRTSLCAFESICDHLNFDADYLRLGLRRLPRLRSETPVSLNNLLRHARRTQRRLTVVPTATRS